MTRPEKRPATGHRRLRSRPAERLESLESRELLATANPIQPFNPSPYLRRIEAQSALVNVTHPIGSSLRTLSYLDNDGKVLSGTTRDGDTWTLTVHGPGVAIVTDTSPNDGALDDEIDTIQIVGSDPNSTYVTGQTSASSRILTDGTVSFNRFTNVEGIASVILQGFVLEETGPAPATPSVALLGGVKTLSFESIKYAADQPTDAAARITIGDPSTPLTYKPSIYITHIFNDSFSGSTELIDGVPRTNPSVEIVVNGEIQDLSIVSATAAPVESWVAARTSYVAYTGRTAVRTFGVNGLKVAGSARNLTVSRTTQPFSSRFSGVDRIGHAYFGGTADAVALDVSNGNIDRLKFLRGLGNPNGTTGTAATESGTPLSQRGYPASGLSGGVIAARQIRRQEYGPANLILQQSQNPSERQLRTTGFSSYATRPGNALTNATVATSGSQGNTTIIGNGWKSLIAAGYDYQSAVQGLQAARSAAHINRIRQRGDLVDSVVQASYSAGADGIYGTTDDVAGNGTLVGTQDGVSYTSTDTAGSGYFAKRIVGNLTAVDGTQGIRPRRLHSVLWRV